MIQSNIPVLDLKPQYESLKIEIQSAINRVLESGQFIMGPDVKLFEQEVARYLGVRHAITVNSGTDALIIGLKALGIGTGDEVITTPFTFLRLRNQLVMSVLNQYLPILILLLSTLIQMQ